MYFCEYLCKVLFIGYKKICKAILPLIEHQEEISEVKYKEMFNHVYIIVVTHHYSRIYVCRIFMKIYMYVHDKILVRLRFVKLFQRSVFLDLMSLVISIVKLG